MLIVVEPLVMFVIAVAFEATVIVPFVIELP